MKMLYSIHNSDEYLFSTYTKDKADLFVKTYNEFNLNQSDYYPDKAYIIKFSSTSNPNKIEKEANDIISNYNYCYLITVIFDKNQDKFFLDKFKKKYLDKNNLWKEELLEYSDTGYKLTFIIADVKDLMGDLMEQTKDIFDNQATIGKEILNLELIKFIKFTEQKIRNSMKGNILYVAFKKDYEYPPRLFKTFSKEKVENFVREYNRQSKDNEDKVGYFSINFSKLEEEADKIIEEYLTLKQVVTIEINKEIGSKTLIGKTLKCGDLNEDLFLSENGFVVTLILDKNCPIDLDSKIIIDKIEYLKSKFDFMLDS